MQISFNPNKSKKDLLTCVACGRAAATTMRIYQDKLEVRLCADCIETEKRAELLQTKKALLDVQDQKYKLQESLAQVQSKLQEDHDFAQKKYAYNYASQQVPQYWMPYTTTGQQVPPQAQGIGVTSDTSVINVRCSECNKTSYGITPILHEDGTTGFYCQACLLVFHARATVEDIKEMLPAMSLKAQILKQEDFLTEEDREADEHVQRLQAMGLISEIETAVNAAVGPNEYLVRVAAAGQAGGGQFRKLNPNASTAAAHKEAAKDFERLLAQVRIQADGTEMDLTYLYEHMSTWWRLFWARYLSMFKSG